MYLNYNKKRKLDELIGSSVNSSNNNSNIFRMLKLTKHTKSKNDEDGEDNEDGSENPLGIPGLFDKQDDKQIYLKDNHLYFHTDVSEESVDEVKKIMRTYWNILDLVYMISLLNIKKKFQFIQWLKVGLLALLQLFLLLVLKDLLLQIHIF